MNKTINDIYEELIITHEDLRAEVLVAELAKKTGVSAADVTVAFEGTFGRAFKKDVIKVQLKSLGNNPDALHLGLSRNGIYDALPEGVFHKEIESKILDYTAARKQQKHEEQGARRLFAPIENELFHQRVVLEQKSAAIINDFGNLDDDFLIDLWKIDKTIPKKYSVRLVKLLPYAHKIAGDLKFTFQCLEKILETRVTYKKRFKKRAIVMEKSNENRLGLDFVLDQEVLEIQQPFLDVTIHTSDKDTVAHFLGDQGLKKFSNVFYQYFIPLEYDIATQIEMQQEEHFVLGQKEGTYMGMTTRL